MAKYAIGLDYGTNSVRALVVDVATGREVGTAVWNYEHGAAASSSATTIRTSPASTRPTTSKGAEDAIRKAPGGGEAGRQGLPARARHRHRRGHHRQHADARGRRRPAAGLRQDASPGTPPRWPGCGRTTPAWPRRAEITALAREIRPHYLAKCGGTYSSEWFFSKILHCLRTAPEVFDAAYTWVEIADWIPAMLTGTEAPGQAHRGRLRGRAQGDVQRRTGAAIPTRSSWRSWTRSWPRFAAACGRRPHTVDQPVGRADARSGPSAPACRRASRWPSGRSTPTWAASGRASRRARWSRSSAPAPAT